jgi:colanic acid/amylovoran biosynthesis glycosyltransferase
MKPEAILYLSSVLPSRSETFVYRELFALRECGVEVLAASVHKPEESLGAPELDALAASAIPVYGLGLPKLASDAFIEGLRHPIRALAVLGTAFRDAARGKDIRRAQRAKVIVQAIGALALVKRIRPFGVGHIHAHMAHVPTSLAMYAAKQLGIPFSFTGHANDLFPNRSLLAEKIERSLFVSCISRWHRDLYSSIHRKDPSRLPIIRCGVDTSKEAFVPAVHEGPLKVLSVGRLVPKKGFDLLIEAVGMIAAGGSVRIELTIVGGGPEEGSLRRQIALLPPSARVTMAGALDNGRVMELMVECELFALPLRITSDGDRDGIPVVLMEAMARGRCVISGDLVTIRELVEQGRSGYLIPTGDVRALADTIEDLALDRARLDLMGKEARKRIEEEFDVKENARALLYAIRESGRII